MTTCKVTCREHKHEVESPFAQDGLAVTRAIGGPDPCVVTSEWRITHIESGLAMPGIFATAATAEQALKAMLPLADWNSSAALLERIEGLEKGVRSAVAPFDQIEWPDDFKVLEILAHDEPAGTRGGG